MKVKWGAHTDGAGNEIHDEHGELTNAGRAWILARYEADWSHICPPRFAGACVDQLDPTARDRIATWTDTPGANLLILGPVGTGKTHAALAAGRERFLDDVTVEFVPVVDLLDRLRPDGRPCPHLRRTSWGVDEPLSWVEHFCNVELLILDDLGGEKASEWTAERLYLIVNDRWLNHRPTVATSNLGPDDLREAIGHRTYDRLRDGAVALQLGGESRRRPL